jgi:hypothetical protein
MFKQANIGIEHVKVDLNSQNMRTRMDIKKLKRDRNLIEQDTYNCKKRANKVSNSCASAEGEKSQQTKEHTKQC